MSIDSLKSDFVDLSTALKAAGGLGFDAHKFLSEWVAPFMERLMDELTEVDDSVEALVSGAEEILHQESGALFAALIASGTAIARELETRAGNDSRIVGIIREHRKLSAQCSKLVEEIVIPDDLDEGDEDDDPAAPPARSLQAGNKGESAETPERDSE